MDDLQGVMVCLGISANVHLKGTSGSPLRLCRHRLTKSLGTSCGLVDRAFVQYQCATIRDGTEAGICMAIWVRGHLAYRSCKSTEISQISTQYKQVHVTGLTLLLSQVTGVSVSSSRGP